MLPSLWPDRRRGGHQYAIDLPGYVALEAADNLSLALALLCAPRDVFLRATISSHPSQTDHVQRTVGLPVAAAVETVAYYLSRGGFHGRDSAQTGEGGLAPQPLRIVSGHDQERRSVVGTDACQTNQLRGDLPNQPIELCVQLGDLC